MTRHPVNSINVFDDKKTYNAIPDKFRSFFYWDYTHACI